MIHIKNRFVIIFLLISIVSQFLFVQLYAQKNNIHPNKVYCDSDYYANDIFQNNDGSFLSVGGCSSGPNADAYIMKLDKDYNFIWKKTYGGSLNDAFQKIRRINNNRFLLAGNTNSIDGDLAAYSWPFSTALNIWLMIVDSNGNFIRGNTYGYGSESDLTGINIRSDGTIFVSGTKVANNGDFATNPGSFLVDQAFVALTDTLLTKKWLRYIVGLPTDNNTTTSSTLDKNENLILSIGSASISGDYAGFGPLAGTYDAFLFCLDTGQNIVWKRRYGGDAFQCIVYLTCDSTNNLFLYASTDSHSGDFWTNEVTLYAPEYSALMKTDSNGNILWKHTYGSFDTFSTELRNVQPTSFVINNDKIWITNTIQGRDSIGEGFGWTPQIGAVDTWVLQCDTQGVLQNKLRIGGLQNDNAQWIVINKLADKPVISMFSVNNTGITNFDCRIVKQSDCKIFQIDQWPAGLNDEIKSSKLIWTISPNPSNGQLRITFEKEFSGDLKIVDQDGKQVGLYKLNRTTRKDLNANYLTDGCYYFEISNQNGRQTKQLIFRK